MVIEERAAPRSAHPRPRRDVPLHAHPTRVAAALRLLLPAPVLQPSKLSRASPAAPRISTVYIPVIQPAAAPHRPGRRGLRVVRRGPGRTGRGVRLRRADQRPTLRGQGQREVRPAAAARGAPRAAGPRSAAATEAVTRGPPRAGDGDGAPGRVPLQRLPRSRLRPPDELRQLHRRSAGPRPLLRTHAPPVLCSVRARGARRRVPPALPARHLRRRGRQRRAVHRPRAAGQEAGAGHTGLRPLDGRAGGGQDLRRDPEARRPTLAGGGRGPRPAQAEEADVARPARRPI
jgi:hypothetical protein